MTSPAVEPVEYGVARASDADGIVAILATAFSTAEPLAVAMNLTLREMEDFLQPMMPAAIAEGLTIVARLRSTGELAGVLLNDDFASPLSPDPNRLSPKLLPIVSLLEMMDEQFRGGRTISIGECLHLFMLGADKRFAGRGIGRGLVEASLHHGARKGYRMAASEATAAASQHIFRKLGFADRYSLCYADFTYERQAVFASIPDLPAAILMDRLLQS